MELSTNLGFVMKIRGKNQRRNIKDAAKLVKDAGFNYVDVGVARLVQEND